MRYCQWCLEQDVPVAPIEDELGKANVCQPCAEDAVGPVRKVTHLFNVGANTLLESKWRVIA